MTTQEHVTDVLSLYWQPIYEVPFRQPQNCHQQLFSLQNKKLIHTKNTTKVSNSTTNLEPCRLLHLNAHRQILPRHIVDMRRWNCCPHHPSAHRQIRPHHLAASIRSGSSATDLISLFKGQSSVRIGERLGLLEREFAAVQKLMQARSYDIVLRQNLSGVP